MSRYTSGSLDIGVYGTRGVPSTYSGYETFLTTLLPELVSRGDRVTMYCRTGEELGAGDWKGVRRRVLPAIPGKNLNTLSHGLVAGAVARVARHDVVLVVNVANAAYSRWVGTPASPWSSTPTGRSGFATSGEPRPAGSSRVRLGSPAGAPRD